MEGGVCQAGGHDPERGHMGASPKENLGFWLTAWDWRYPGGFLRVVIGKNGR